MGICLNRYGTPLICNGNLAGISISSILCEQSKLPAIYGDVFYYREWILKNVGKVAGGKRKAIIVDKAENWFVATAWLMIGLIGILPLGMLVVKMKTRKTYRLHHV